ncbi:hypothetical protein GALMADRAFT_137429 [Galerina marginata CBS 339.88]|uniref:Amino acid transporter transmembrane domain-containing protein n=1 Tax=Galerina marginata (strain CBS 339.88) TaxID=685588 RepID=A0A067T8V5_GALM3|nr:hypothetical protein GALMADRAFT_137429 [Galerina marginata CBS 339.88]
MRHFILTMRRHAHIIGISLVILTTIHCVKADIINRHQCLARINALNIEGKTDNHGNPLPPSSSNATAITYDLCVSQCGAGQEPFQWTVFSQQFNAWLLPWLALVSQLPFGANDKLDNLESMLLTLGSPTLAAYSLALTVLNGRWVAKLFARYRYPNTERAVWILNSLQQSSLRVDTDNARLASLIILPQNDRWWEKLKSRLEYEHTWSISAATSIVWVIIAYVFTIIDYFSAGLPTALNANGQGVGSIGSLWLWLLPIVVGWLQISPKCDSIRLYKAVVEANSIAYVATNSAPPILASRISNEQAISIELTATDNARVDECATPPVYNYARFLPWRQSVMLVSDAFAIVSERNHIHDQIIPKVEWRCRNAEDADLMTASHLKDYSKPREGSRLHQLTRRHGLDASALSRMLIASGVALTLQWGTTGAAAMIVWFTPTIGLGCRSATYILYGVLSTVVWFMLVTSSILTHYSTNCPAQLFGGDFVLALRARVARLLAIFLRRSGKVIATINAVWIVATGMIQFSSFYDRCYCNSSVFGLGIRAYDVITLLPSDIAGMRAAWIGGFVLAGGATLLFAGFVTLLIDPLLPP